MQRKIIIYGALYCYLLFATGCSLNKPKIQQTVELQQQVAETTSQKSQDKSSITDKDMKMFFDKYLKLDEETMLILNQKPKVINDEYWSAYSSYQTKTDEVLGQYLSDSTKNKLKQQYLHDEFHYPRFVKINDYVIVGITNVEDAVIISKDLQDTKSTYEVKVTATAKVISIDEANKLYKWDEDKGYYIKRNSVDRDKQSETESKVDKIKIHLSYWVEVPVGNKFIVDSVKEKHNLSLRLDDQGSPKNNYFISRIPYLEEVRQKDQEKIYKFIDLFMKQEYNFYKHYEKAYNTNYDMLKMVMESDLGLKNVVNMKKENYKACFNPFIIPIKDDMSVLTFNLTEDVSIMPHPSSSEKRPVYEVKIEADVTFLNGEVLPYEYIYLFVFEDDMISKVTSK